jgi:hypothetical protein
MSDIPEDIRARSVDVWNRVRAENSPQAIMEALMAERERAAKIADRRANYLSKVKGYASEVTELLTTSAAIRAESEAENRT